MTLQAENTHWRLRIVPDPEPLNPRDADPLSTWVCWHPRYTLGDSHDYARPQEFLAAITPRVALIFPLYLYDHSGLTVSLDSFLGRAPHAAWDSRQVGFAYVLRSTVRQEYGISRITPIIHDKVRRRVEVEVQEYNQYLHGDIYGFLVEAKSVCDHGMVHYDPVESVWGFYGDDWNVNGLADFLSDEVRPLLQALA
ncbi:MAG: hypothetical protein C7B46_19730 [Sulfobacillus benefaciens]|uniref:Uncharacterized protein n=1 Tax=Sulfobacillus benefaciens TaxID=453960 RepID=A0A2T2WX50_9FIRM|nr:MAG: hypothetical protein C7B46_19730 [Sulfobacillus benefaciens]